MDNELLKDEELIVLYHKKDEEAFNILLRRYRVYIKRIANNYRNYPWVQYTGLDDLLGIGDLCFYTCIDTFKNDRGCSFKTYFTKCLNRKFSYLRSKVYNLKNKAMYEAISISNHHSFDRETIKDIEELAIEKSYDSLPDRSLVVKETLESINSILDKEASALEKKIFELGLHGFSLEEIANKLNIDKRSVSNARYRIRNKIKNFNT